MTIKKIKIIVKMNIKIIKNIGLKIKIQTVIIQIKTIIMNLVINIKLNKNSKMIYKKLNIKKMNFKNIKKIVALKKEMNSFKIKKIIIKIKKIIIKKSKKYYKEKLKIIIILKMI